MFPSKKLLPIGAVALVLFVMALPGVSLGVLQWETVGPDGGDRFEVKISPLDNQILFVYGNRGIHRSTNAGATWVSVATPEMIHYNSILSLDFDPHNPLIMYLGGKTRGIWKSVDGGQTWASTNTGIPLLSPELNFRVPIVSLVVGPSGAIYAGSVDPTSLGVPGAAWIYASTDGGSTWHGVDSGIDILSGEPLTQTTNVLLSRDLEGQIWAMVYGGGAFRLEHGVWVPHNGNLPESALRATHLVNHPTRPNMLYLGTEDDWVYRSSNYGATWTRLTLPPEIASLPVLPLVYCIAIDPNNRDIVVVRAHDNFGSNEQPLFRPREDQTEGRGLYYTFNAGATWLRRATFLFRMTFDPAQTIQNNIPGVGIVNRSKVSYITSGGSVCVRKSIDGQATFNTSINGIDNILINAVFAHSNPPVPYSEIIYGGAESGLFITEGGTTPAWKRQKSVQDHLYTWSFAENFSDPNKVFYSTGNPAWNFPDQRGVYEAEISCLMNPTEVCPPGSQLLANVGVWKVVTTPANPLKVYAACQEDGIMVSDNGGQTWNPFNAGLVTPISITDITLAADGTPLFASSRASNGEIWPPTLSETGALYSYNSHLLRWEKVPGIDLAVMALDFDGANDTHFAATVDGIYRSTDGWTTWERYLHDAPNIFTDVLVDPTRPDTIYASSFDGVFRSVDGGLSWQEISENITAREVNQLAMDANSGILYAGTTGSSICRLLPDDPLQPGISFNISGIDFGQVPVGSTSEASLIITNYGEADLIVSSIVPNHNDITIVESFPQTLAPWDTSVVTVRFSPTATQAVNAFAVITSNDPNSPTIYFPVNGEGIARAPVMPDIKVNGYDFPPPFSRGIPLSLAISLSPGGYGGVPSELWLGAQTPVGPYWYVAGFGWISSSMPVRCATIGILDFHQPIKLGSGLPKGSYQFDFTVDDNVNGSLEPVWSDTVFMSVE